MKSAEAKRIQELVGLVLFLLAVILIAHSGGSFAAIPADNSVSIQQSR